jgi:acetoin utilization deacetylase AcuC-like enzyme
MLVVHSPRYEIDLGAHVFPTIKYTLTRRALENIGGLPLQFIEPEPASWEQLALVHTADYLTKLRDGTLSAEEIAQLELPWSRQMVDGFRLMCGGTITAALAAFEQRTSPGVVCHIGGGLHHAFPNHGEGFCPLNDVAAAAGVLLSRGARRIAIVDLDVHHGNGTAFIFNHGGVPPETIGDGQVFTLSIHQQHNYPFWKPRSSVDIGLPDGAGDATYLRELEPALTQVMASQPQVAFYLAGADPFEDDQLGGLGLTRAGLRARDRMVMDTFAQAGVPLIVTLAGGYSRRVEDTVAIHVATILVACDVPVRGVRL